MVLDFCSWRLFFLLAVATAGAFGMDQDRRVVFGDPSSAQLYQYQYQSSYVPCLNVFGGVCGGSSNGVCEYK